jgi:hypothetical protein
MKPLKYDDIFMLTLVIRKTDRLLWNQMTKDKDKDTDE